MAKLKLPNVTLIAVDNVCRELTELALADTLDLVEPDEVIIFSDAPLRVPNSIFYKVEIPNNEAAERIIWEKVPHAVKTTHFLTIQWDGFVISTDDWRPYFMEFDYIGAPWPHVPDDQKVGNGGFSLRSVEMTKYVADHPNVYPYAKPEDATLCRVYAKDLTETCGFKWAPPQVAVDFAIEHFHKHPHMRPGHFGFHDLLNFPLLMSGDRLKQRMELVMKNPYAVRAAHYEASLHMMDRFGSKCGNLARAIGAE